MEDDDGIELSDDEVLEAPASSPTSPTAVSAPSSAASPNAAKRKQPASDADGNAEATAEAKTAAATAAATATATAAEAEAGVDDAAETAAPAKKAKKAKKTETTTTADGPDGPEEPEEWRRGLDLDPVYTVGPMPAKCRDSVPCRVGIDEAGRGPVLGPMVYGAAYWPVSEGESIEKLGFDDSKALKEDDRKRFYKVIEREAERIGHVICDLPAEHISASMLLRSPVSLNAISHDTAIAMIKKIEALGVNVTEIYVDAVGNCEYYQARLEREFPGATIVVCPKADAIYKVVGAASIFAKVTRDDSLKQWVFREQYGPDGRKLALRRPLDRMDCSGYPSDERTIKWLRENADPVFGFPAVVRFSWKTARNMMCEYDEDLDAAERAKLQQKRVQTAAPDFCQVEWESSEQMAGMASISSMFKRNSAPPRAKFFSDRRLAAVGNLLRL